MNKKIHYFIQPVRCHRNLRCLWPIHPVFPGLKVLGKHISLASGEPRSTQFLLQSLSMAVQWPGERGGSPSECQGSGVTGLTGFYYWKLVFIVIYRIIIHTLSLVHCKLRVHIAVYQCVYIWFIYSECTISILLVY